MKPLLTYYGGKQKMVPILLQLIPQHNVYCEPFAGGAALFWAKGLPKNDSKYVECLNDLWGALINFYKIVQNETTFDQLLKLLDQHPYSRQLHNEYKLVEYEDKTLEAMRLYVLIMMSFSKIYKSGWAFSYKNNDAKKFHSKIEQLLYNKSAFLRRLKGVYIDCLDALDCIERWDRSDTFFYVDPPYIEVDQGYAHQYSERQYQRLCTALTQIKGKFLLSSYPNAIADAHNWYNIDINVRCSVSKSSDTEGKRESRVERLYANYVLPK